MNIQTLTSNVMKSLNFQVSIIFLLQVSNYIFLLLHFNIEKDIASNLLVNNQIRSHHTRSNNQMSILRVNRSKANYFNLHNVMITGHSEPDVLNVHVFFSVLEYKV